MDAMAASSSSSSCSPRTLPLQLPQYLPLLLHTFLHLSLHNQTFPSPLPNDFCSSLLEDQPPCHLPSSGPPPHSQWRPSPHQPSSSQESTSITSDEGVPMRPLYKHLASVLCKWIATGSFPKILQPMEGLSKDEDLMLKIHTWNKRMAELGATLKEIAHSVKYQLEVQEPFFSLLKDGSKRVEGRCALGAYRRMQPRDVVLVNNVLLLEIQGVSHYDSFEKMLASECLDNVLPGVTSIAEGVMVYRRFYSEEKEKIGGVLAIHVRCLPAISQPFKVISDILEMLHVNGVRALLGFRFTVGTASNSLPPARSTLISSFVVPNDQTEAN